MSGPSTSIDLTDAEKRDLIALIQAGRPPPDNHRFLLFEDKREVELVWNGKTRDVCTTVLPFQTLEDVDEPRAEAASSSQAELFDARGRQTKGWTNKLIWGDNKLILSSLKSGPLREQIEEAGGLKLIYIDPPFGVGADFSMDIEIGGVDYGSRKEIIRHPRGMAAQASLVAPVQAELSEWEDWWTGGYVFENVWQSFRTRQDRSLELTTAAHTYTRPGCYQVAVKVIDIFGNDTMTLLPVHVS